MIFFCASPCVLPILFIECSKIEHSRAPARNRPHSLGLTRSACFGRERVAMVTVLFPERNQP